MAKKGGGPTPTQQKLQQRQLREIEKLESVEAQQKIAAGRRSRGRSSLISGSERGIVEGSDFAQKNLATKERLGAEAAARAKAAAEAARLDKKRRTESFLESPGAYARSLLS